MLLLAKILVSLLIVVLTLLLSWILAYDKRNGFAVFFLLAVSVAFYTIVLK